MAAGAAGDVHVSLRIRADGRILCAAMHEEEPGDVYMHDGISYRLTCELGVLVTEEMHQEEGRGGHAKHGEWWWRDAVPDDVVADWMMVPEEHRPAEASGVIAGGGG